MKILFQPNQYSQQRQHEKKVWIYPVLLAMYATYLKNKGHEILWDWKKTEKRIECDFAENIESETQIDVPFLELPSPDRRFTNAFNPKYQENGNFKYLPATYMQASLDCWYGKCTFCRWAKQYPKCYTRPVKTMIAEVQECVDMGFKEIFDDSGTFPKGAWLMVFCEEMIKSGLNKKVRIGCNMRLDYNHPNLKGLKDIRRAGFRMILYGLESANQATLDKINKGVNIYSAIDYIKRSAKAGLDPHIAVMFGYPWESHKDAIKTLKLVHYLLRKGYAKTAQASFYNPKLDKERIMMSARRFGKTTAYIQGVNTYMSAQKFIRKIYNVGYDPRFWINRIFSIRSVADIKYLYKGIRRALK